MGRPRTKDKHLPERVYLEGGRYRYKPKEGKPIELGPDFTVAMHRYANEIAPTVAKITDVGKLRTVGEIGDHYMLKVVPQKAPRTQHDNAKEWKNLKPAFGHLLPDEVTPQLVYKYMAARGARVRANREKALLSHMLTYAVFLGKIRTNPLYGAMRRDMIGHGERPRLRLPTDREVDIFKSVSSDPIRTYVDLKQKTGLRKGDILTLVESDLREEGIYVMPRKGRRLDPETGERVGAERIIQWDEELHAIVNRALDLKRGTPTRRLASNVAELPPRRRAPWLFATRAGQCYYDTDTASADGFDAIWKRYMKKAIAAAAAAGWTMKSFTEHDVRAKAGTDAERAGQQGHKLLGNSEAMFRRTYARGIEVVEPLRRK